MQSLLRGILTAKFNCHVGKQVLVLLSTALNKTSDLSDILDESGPQNHMNLIANMSFGFRAGPPS